jgi:hypothetical protein
MNQIILKVAIMIETNELEKSNVKYEFFQI